MRAYSIVMLFLAVASPIHPEQPMITEGLEISQVKALIGKRRDGKDGACVGMTVQNNSAHTYLMVKVRVTFLDKLGKPFFEDTQIPFLSSIFNTVPPLKPNYSFRATPRCTVEGIDLQRWDEGKVRIEIIETDTLHQRDERFSGSDDIE
ncbi:MAG: hypothetical protein CMN76_00050 [Spirochaetaceae bacterium]|nr:hypothetical protein [Spirochaetaceae bacterium]